MQINIKSYAFVLLLLLPIVSNALGEDEKEKTLLDRVFGNKPSFSIPKTTHHHTVEMFSHASAVRIIACSLCITGLVMIKQSLMSKTEKDTIKKAEFHVLVPTFAGIIFTVTGICGILYDHKIINCIQ